MSERTRYVCQGCGHISPKWLGRCPDCGQWNSMLEEAAPAAAAGRVRVPAAGETKPLGEIDAGDEPRLPTGSSELDRVLGGGIVPGSVVLLGGDPGIGKTTLLLECLGRLSAARDVPVLYASGEESPRQIKLRADRLSLEAPRLFVGSHRTVEDLLAAAASVKPGIVVVDSIQTMVTSRLESTAGSVSQVRQVGAELAEFSKWRDIPVFLVGHVTKDGTLAGPRVLEHMVDTVLYFEGERTRDYRILRAVKNRFGSISEIGVFEMGRDGLREIANPSRLFLRESRDDLAGSVVTAAVEGTRPFLVEVQALAAPSAFATPRRGVSGADPQRFAMLVAVLEKKVGLELADHDLYLNFAGGLRVNEPAADLGIFAAVCSGFRNRAVDGGTVLFGEVGLTGEVRAVNAPEMRVREALKLGFDRCILPASNRARVESEGVAITCEGISHVSELIDALFS